jgi:hypothetical protein
MIIILSNSLKEEIPHAVDYRCDPDRLVASWFFRAEYKFKLPADRELDSCFDRYRRHPHRLAPVGDCLDPRFCENRRAGLTDRRLVQTTQKADFD